MPRKKVNNADAENNVKILSNLDEQILPDAQTDTKKSECKSSVKCKNGTGNADPGRAELGSSDDKSCFMEGDSARKCANAPESPMKASESGFDGKDDKDIGREEKRLKMANKASEDDGAEKTKKKAPAQYKQRRSNKEVREAAALEYIERNTKPRPARDKTKHLLTADSQLLMEPGANARYVMFGMAIYNMDPIDINNVEEVKARIGDYFQLCIDADMKPGVANLAMALGIDRHRLLDVVNDAESRSNVPIEVRLALKKAHAYMGAYWEQITQNGKINPAAAIFLGKNNFGYRDQTEHVLTPNTRMTDTISPDEMQRRIAAIPED